MSDTLPFQVFKHVLNGVAAGASIGAKGNTSINVTIGTGNVVTTRTSLATGALAGGVIVGALTACYLYREELAEVFNACWKRLVTLAESLYEEALKAWNKLKETVKTVFGTIWETTSKVIYWVLETLRVVKRVDPKDIKKVTGKAKEGIKGLINDVSEEIESFGKKNGVAVDDVLNDLANTGKKAEENISSIETAAASD